MCFVDALPGTCIVPGKGPKTVDDAVSVKYKALQRYWHITCNKWRKQQVHGQIGPTAIRLVRAIVRKFKTLRLPAVDEHLKWAIGPSCCHTINVIILNNAFANDYFEAPRKLAINFTLDCLFQFRTAPWCCPTKLSFHELLHGGMVVIAASRINLADVTPKVMLWQFYANCAVTIVLLAIRFPCH